MKRTNLTIGALYLDGLFKRWNNHSALSLASYNAGPGAAARWLEAEGAAAC